MTAAPVTAIAWSHRFDLVMADLRAAVRAAGGTERDAVAIAAAAVRRELRPDHPGPCAATLVQHAAIRMKHGIPMATVLKDLKR